MNKEPLVSVVIPVFNSANTIAETLDSVVAQTYKEWEIICVDDGSTDGSIPVVNEYIDAHKGLNIKILLRDTQNKGGSVCRNIGARAASGDYLIFLDADDLLGETCLEKRVAAISETDNQFVVFPMASFRDGALSEARIYSRLYVNDPLYFFITGFGTWQVTSPIIRKSFFDQLGGYDESFPRMQDVEFHIRAIIESKKHFHVYKEASPDCFYRQNGQATVKTEKLKASMIGAKKLVALIAKYEQQGAFEDKRKLSLALLSLYCHLCNYISTIQIVEKNYRIDNPLLTSSLMKNEGVIGRIVIRMIELLPNAKARLFCSRALDKNVRKKLKK